MAKKKSKRTDELQFSQKTKEKIYYRDNMQCIFCAMGYYNKCESGMLLQIKDIMHFVPKSQGGKRKDMLKRFEAYLRSIYPDWKETDLIYKKYDF